MNPTCLKQTSDGVLLSIHAQPNARRSEVAGMHGEELKIRLHAPPVEGKANVALIEFLHEVLGISKSEITLVRGETSRSKQVLVRGRTAEEIREKLLGGAINPAQPS